MGTVAFGVPADITLALAKKNNSRIFVETGTYQGKTTRWAAGQFQAVHTIERSEIVYHQFGSGLKEFPVVTRYLGDSREVLPKILEKCGSNSAVFWLDGHWSGGDTAGMTDECPLLDELQCLAARSDDIILIDDARFFLAAPPRPHDPGQWPDLPKIIRSLPNSGAGRLIQVIDDVIFIVPDKPPIRECLTQYAQDRAAELTLKPRKLRTKLRSLLHLT